MNRGRGVDQYQVSMNVLRAIDEIRVDDDFYCEDGFARAKAVRVTVRSDGAIALTIVWRKKGVGTKIKHKGSYVFASEVLASVLRRRSTAAA